jgi:hypothetical protein
MRFEILLADAMIRDTLDSDRHGPSFVLVCANPNDSDMQ